MKTIFTLFLSFIASIALMAADVRPKSNLMIRTAERGDIRVVIDGRRFESNDNSLRIRGLDAGNHRVRIYREKNNGRYNLFGKRFELVFDRNMRFRPQSSTLISIDRFGRAMVREGRRNGWSQRDDRYDRDRRYDNNRDIDDWEDDRVWDRNRDFDYDDTRNSGDYDFDNDYGYGNRAMSDMEFNRVIQAMQREWLETNKQKSARQVISTSYLTTSQVRQMLQLFSFENIKLDLAKQAYMKTVDRQNYESIMGLFSFNSSREELRRFIRTAR